jgi:hypothetical protein
MSDRNQNKKENDALQSGEGDLALGQDAGSFGAGGQKVQQALSGKDSPDRDIQRDGSLPQGTEGTDQ